MGILDEAIREHLELKRQHGADEPELKKLEDEALGAPGGPGEIEEPLEMSDAEAEAPTDYIGSPAAAPGASELAGASEGEAPAARADAPTPAPDLRPPEMRPEEPPPSTVEPSDEEPAGAEATPAEEEHPAIEHEVPESEPEEAASQSSAEPPEPPPVEAGGVSAELRAEREQISQHPTEHYDVEGEMAEAEKEAAGFFNEQSLSDELDQALDSAETAPPTEDPIPAEATDEVEVEVEVPEEPEEEVEVAEVEEVEEPEPEEVEEAGEGEAAEQEPDQPEKQNGEENGDEDVLEETPEFLQDSPEHDRLWFEQKPPKDFDFDD